MPEVQAYKSTERRGETFSYLPPMTPDRMRQQIAYLHCAGLESGHRAHRAGEILLELLVPVETALLWRAVGRADPRRTRGMSACQSRPSCAPARLRQLHPVARHGLHRLPRGLPLAITREPIVTMSSATSISSSSGRAASLARRRALSQGKSALPPATERVRTG